MRAPTGAEVTLVPGDLIGRMSRAALRIEDPRISEAHALVSLRGAGLKLLALRGRLTCRGKPLTEVALRPGMRLLLGGFYAIVVLDVTVPDRVVALKLPGLAPVVLDGVTSIHLDASGPRVVPGFDPAATATAWASEAGVHIRTRDGDERVLAPEVGPAAAGAETLAATMDITTEAGTARVGVTLVATTADRLATAETGRFDVPLRIVLHYDTVHIHPAQGATVALDGIGARLIFELAALSTPVAWEALAKALWSDETDPSILRQRWDQITSRVRKRLRDGRIRADLVRSNGLGLVELYLGPDDRIEDLA